MAVNPVAGTNTTVATGGTAVIAAPANLNGGYITNPAFAIDQNLSVAEVLYVDPVAVPGLSANGTTVALQPGESYELIPESSKSVYANAATSGHKFTCVVY